MLVVARDVKPEPESEDLYLSQHLPQIGNFLLDKVHARRGPQRVVIVLDREHLRQPVRADRELLLAGLVAHIERSDLDVARRAVREERLGAAGPSTSARRRL